MNSTSLADYYADQLKAANWTQEDSGQSGPLSWSSWKVEDEDSLIWNGIMIALKLPEAANRRLSWCELVRRTLASKKDSGELVLIFFILCDLIFFSGQNDSNCYLISNISV